MFCTDSMTCLSSACGPQFEDPVFIEASYSTVIDQRVAAMQYPSVRVQNTAPGCTIHLPRRVMSLAFVCHAQKLCHPGNSVNVTRHVRQVQTYRGDTLMHSRKQTVNKVEHTESCSWSSRLKQFWFPSNLLFTLYCGLFSRGWSCRGVKLTTHLQLKHRQRKSVSVTPLPLCVFPFYAIALLSLL
jgi:hypothetical protein